MNKLVLLLAVLFLQGCVSFGLSIHNNKADKVEFDEPLLGVVRFQQEGSPWFCEHVSGVVRTEAGYGLNHCGYLADWDTAAHRAKAAMRFLIDKTRKDK